ncbi:methionine synthase [Thermoactinomyces mirandus]|uniref:Methionine synthase n=1 Tax=Thermoactinomyces mirandus TaxID=2756294 RepID=A0A7W1XS59_9BACL|nr:methionine synthase [Thermoactinomyces mirandus]MBA4602156.1 methionine synthase [Thermoactinomyces mirandus]
MILDGAMGTMLQQAGLTAEDFGGEKFEGCNEILNLTRPDLIEKIHDTYYRAGADMVETNTFGATPLVLAEYDLQDRTEEINLAAARSAVKMRDLWSTDDHPRYVAGAMGPTTKTLSVTGGTTFEALAEGYYRQAKALIEGGVDLLLLETAQDTLNVKAGGIGIERAFNRTGKRLPVMISGTIEPMGTMLGGQNIDAFYLSIEHLRPIAVGLNCATGPEFMTDHIRTLSGMARCYVSCYPNAGLPDENGNYLETPEAFARKIADFADKGWLNLAGGCCGTTPEHIQAVSRALAGKKPRRPAEDHLPGVSGIEPVFLEQDNRPLLVGERTNVIGSRKFKRLVREGKYEEAAEIARRQVKGGAQIIDVCLADPDRDEMADMEAFLRHVTKMVKVPLMIDSTNARVIEKALQYSQGKAVINSINLEEGEKRFAEILPLVRQFGAAVVVGTIDERGMAVTAERKLEIALRSHDLLVNKYGIPEKDIIFDPLVFPAGTGDGQYIRSAGETVEGIRRIKKALPGTATILGVSNVSFGLPIAGREVLNAVYLYACIKAGLDYAIVNAERLERYASIPEEERKLAETLLFGTNRGNYDDVLARFTSFYRDKKAVRKQEKIRMTLEERLAGHVIEGSKDGLFADLDEALARHAPLDIINGPLLAGMDEVGRLFNENQLIVAEVLQSAEVMKAAVAYLEPHMDSTGSHARGKVLLATVKGDVHDIGKNLVEMILSNNGYEVVNLGIKVPPEQLIEAVRKEKPDLIGLSGLLVKSARQMAVTVQDLKDAGIEIPVLVGGAALTRKFTDTQIASRYNGPVLYAKDAMNGLELANQLMNPGQCGKIGLKKWQKTEEAEDSGPSHGRNVTTAVVTPAKSKVNRKVPVFVPPDLKRHIYRDYPLDLLKPYINLQMLFGKHLGLKGNVEDLIARGNPKALELKQTFDQVMEQAKQEQILSPQGMYQFFPAQAKGNDILIYDPDNPGRVLERFSFPRQSGDPYLCLADFVRPVESGEMDYVGFLAVTAGIRIREAAQVWKEKGDYLHSHMLQAASLETAEACAEQMHQIMRNRWGFPDPADMTIKERFGAKYQGIRVSFGYPACPNLEDQQKLFRLISPEEIGIGLTDGFMMEPEASVSAMVFAHPEARYFNAK